jgi:WD40 repeat protein
MFSFSSRIKIELNKFSAGTIIIAMLSIPLLTTELSISFLTTNNWANQISYINTHNITFPSSVHSLSYSPSGDLLTIAYGRYCDYYGVQNKDDPPHWEGGVAIISMNTWEVTETLKGHSGMVEEIIWKPQGDILATVSLDKTVIFWNASSWQILRRMTIPQARDYGPAGEIAFEWSPDGKRFAISLNDDIIWVCSFQNLTVLGKLKAGPKAILTLAWSPDGRYLASGGWTDTVIIWDMKDLKSVKELQLGACRTVTWSPDGRFLAAGSKRVKSLTIWDTESWELVFSQHLSFVSRLSWSLDGKKLAVARWERTILIYSTDTWNVTSKILDTYGVRLVQWGPNSKELATGMYDPGATSIWQEYTS